MKVLIVDDSHNVVETIADYLELEGIVIDCAYHGEAALQLVSDNHYDVIIMDIMMPKMDGLSAVKRMREELFCNTPVLFLTAKDRLEDKIAGFQSGGDDYLLKPFALQELSIRLHALAVRGPRQDIGNLSYGDISVNTRTGQTQRAGRTIKISHIQLKILKTLLRQAPAVVSRQQVISSVWGEDTPNSDALRSHIYSLRNALDHGFEQSRLETIHGKGYRIKS